MTTAPGPATLGVGDRGARRRAAHRDPGRDRSARVPSALRLPERGAARAAAAARGERRARRPRRLLALLRTESKAPAPGPLGPPVGSVGSGFGEPRTYTGVAEVESLIDALAERAPPRARLPARRRDARARAGRRQRSLRRRASPSRGGAVVIDHGQGVVSVLHHLASVAVRQGDVVDAAARSSGCRDGPASRPSRCSVARLPPRRRRGPAGAGAAALSEARAQANHEA